MGTRSPVTPRLEKSGFDGEMGWVVQQKWRGEGGVWARWELWGDGEGMEGVGEWERVGEGWG